MQSGEWFANDGSPMYAFFIEFSSYGCTDPYSSNYDEAANVDDGSCVGSPVNPLDFRYAGELDGHYYYLSTIGFTNFNNAKQFCIDNSGYLISITSETENTLASAINGNTMFIGLEKIGSTWQWASGESLSYTSWHTGQPDGNANSVLTNWGFNNTFGNGLWDDNSDGTNGQIILEMKPGCTDELACNHNPEASWDDGSCEYLDCAGECGGTAEVDECGVCDGDGLSCLYCVFTDEEGNCMGNYSINEYAIYAFNSLTLDGVELEDGDWLIARNDNVIVGVAEWAGSGTEVVVIGEEVLFDGCPDCSCDSGPVNTCGMMLAGQTPQFYVFDWSASVESIAQYEADDGTQLQDIPPYSVLDFNVGLSLNLVSDCNGDMGGSASVDDCGNCWGGNTGLDNPINEFELGDVNEDCNLDVLDIVTLVDCALQPGFGEECYIELGDVNPDGVINILDIVTLVNWIMNGMPTEPVTDIDGNVYETVQIGEQIWMAENLKVTHYSDGQPIPTGFSNDDWGILDYGAYAVYNDDPSNADIYGNLYNWFAVDDEGGVCPEGWYVPSDEEFMELEIYLGMSEEDANSTGYRGTDEGSKLAGHSDLWNDGNLENNSEFGTSGFTFLPASGRGDNGTYNGMGDNGYFWSSSEYFGNYAWERRLYYDDSSVARFSPSKLLGFSIRCLKN